MAFVTGRETPWIKEKYIRLLNRKNAGPRLPPFSAAPFAFCFSASSSAPYGGYTKPPLPGRVLGILNYTAKSQSETEKEKQYAEP